MSTVILSKQNRLDRFISHTVSGIKRKDVRLLLARKEIMVDGVIATDSNQVINEFSIISLQGKTLQNIVPRYIMLNKPKGVVSATKDHVHKTVLDLLTEIDTTSLHIVGRLDYNTSGLMLLSNDGRWSRQLTSPVNKVAKVYKVALEKDIDPDLIKHFAQGLYFGYEKITTKPAQLEIVSEKLAKLTLIEGRYHQVKRMFAQFDNKVLELHRLSIGTIQLDPQLQPGQSRLLHQSELDNV